MTADLHHLAAAYALDALDERERREFEAHYPTCSICAADVDAYRETAAGLAESVATAPPPGLKAGVMGEIRRTRQLPPLVADLGARRPRFGRQILAVAAAALVLIVASFVVLDRNDPTDVNEIVDAPDAVFTSLEGDRGSLEIIWSPSRNQVAVVGNGLEPVGPEQAMALWFLLPDGVAPAGLFFPDGAGRVRTVIDVDDLDTTGWGVTVEPRSGSPQPTGDVIYSASV